jgi:hypothetical protein
VPEVTHRPPLPDESSSPLFVWRKAIARSDLPAVTRLVAFTLSLHMSAHGNSCRPAMATVGAEAGVNEATARRHVGDLVRLGWLERTERPGRTAMFCAAHPSCETLPLTSDATPYVGQESRETTPLQDDDATPYVAQHPSPPVPREGRTSVRTYSEDVTHTFADFWALYPRKTDRDDAEKAWAKAVTRKPPADIIAAIARTAEHWRNEGYEKRFIPHGATWLNKNRWNDELIPLRRAGNERSERNATARQRIVGIALGEERPALEATS